MQINGLYSNRVLVVDLACRTSHIEALPSDWRYLYLGGRGFNVRRLYDAVRSETDPLSPDNPLIIGVGPLVGTAISGAARFNVTAKSPQTEILGDSNAGGHFALGVKAAGLDQIVVEQVSSDPLYLFIDGDQVQLRDARHLWGLDVWAAHERLQKDHPGFEVACVGPAAEAGVKFAGIFCNLVRAAARTGMGTLMAAKGLKAVCIRGRRAIRLADPDTFSRLSAAIDQRVVSHAEYDARTLMGTTKLVHALNQAGYLATQHYQYGRFAAADQVSGERLAETYKQKNKGCAACSIPCSRFFSVSDGPHRGLKSEGPEFEGLAGFSSRVGVTDLATALKGVDLCNRYGMDVISVSECISFAMECFEKGYLSSGDCDGLELRFGNAEATLIMIERIARREGLGDLLADGVRRAAEQIGGASREIAMHVKGLELFQADPRGLKGYALGNAVASRGGDHLRSEPSFEFSEDDLRGEQLYGTADAAYRLRYRGKGRVVKHYEEWSALADCLEACKNTIVNMEILDFAGAADLLRAGDGGEWDAAMVQRACERVVNLERLFLVRQGLRRQDDRLPARFLKEPLGPDSGPSAGSVVELEPMLDEYYGARRWDQQTGIPTLSKLRELGLEREARELMADGVPLGESQ